MSVGFRHGDSGWGGIEPGPSVPDGKTVTPINSVPIWISCAGIVGCSYTTLGEVLNDVGIIEELITNHNAMDYLVRCKDWMTSLNLVPNMTSNTTPSGVCSASHILDANHQAYYSFNNASNQAWHSTDGNPQWLMYKFDQPTVVNYVRLKTSSVGGPKTSVIQASTDNTSWVDLGDFIDCNSTDTWFEKYYDNEAAYTYYRIRVTSSNYTSSSKQYTTFPFLQFCTAGITNYERAMYFIGQNNYASDTLLADTDWLEAIINSQYVDYILNSKVPVMSSMNTPYGQILPTNGTSTVLIKAFDGVADSSSSRHYAYIGFPNGWIGYQFIDSTKVYLVSWYNNADASTSIHYLINGNIRYSDDGTNWTTILELTNQTGKAALSKFTHIIQNPSAHKYWSLQCMSAKCASSDSNFYFNRLQFIGRTDIPDPSPEPSGYKALIPMMTSNTTPSGVASANKSDSTPAYYAFDGSSSTRWGVQQTADGDWIQYKFTKPVCAKQISTIAITVNKFAVAASNDGTNFFKLATLTVDTTETTNDIQNDNYYLYYRLIIDTSLSSSRSTFSTIQFYGYEYVPGQALIPVMTSDTTPEGIVTASSVYGSGYPGWKAFDSDRTTGWASSTSSAVSSTYLQYKFYNKRACVKCIKLIVNYLSSKASVGAFSLLGSNDGTSWYTVLENATVNTNTLCEIITSENRAVFIATIQNEEYYMYYRLANFATSLYSNYVQIQECQLYGNSQYYLE